MMASRVHSASHSSMLWLVSTTVRPAGPSCQHQNQALWPPPRALREHELANSMALQSSMLWLVSTTLRPGPQRCWVLCQGCIAMIPCFPCSLGLEAANFQATQSSMQCPASTTRDLIPPAVSLGYTAEARKVSLQAPEALRVYGRTWSQP